MKPEPLVDDWRNRGTCRNFDPAPWFPATRADRALDAREACVACPVREQCAQFALSTGAKGIWAGYHLPFEKDGLRQYLELVERAAVPAPAEPEREPVERCVTCSCEVYRRRDRAHRKPGQRVYGGRGMCATCYLREIRRSRTTLVDPAPALQHLTGLLAARMTLDDVAKAAELELRVVRDLWARRHTITKVDERTAQYLRAVQVPAEVAS